MLLNALCPMALAAKEAAAASANMGRLSAGQVILLSLFGFSLVFIFLVAIMAIIKLIASGGQKAAPGSVEKAASNATANVPAKSGQPLPEAGEAAVIPPGKRLATGSLGDIELNDVDDRTAAILMAIVADKIGAPLNELRFKSILRLP